MQIRFESSRKEVSQMDTATLRENFLIENIFQNDQINFVYTHYDRVMIGGRWRVIDGAIPGLDLTSLRRAHGLAAERYA